MPPKGSRITITKRRQQLTRQLVLDMMDRNENGQSTPGLLSKLMIKLEGDLDSTDIDLRHKAMDKIIRLMPFVIAKERSPAVQLNVQNNTITSPQITTGKSTVLAVNTIQSYLKDREKRMQKKALPPIEDAEIIEVTDGNKEKKIEKTDWVSPIEEDNPTDDQAAE